MKQLGSFKDQVVFPIGCIFKLDHFGVNGVASLSARQGRRKYESNVKVFLGVWVALAAAPWTPGLFFFMTSPLLTDPHLRPSPPRLTSLFPPCCSAAPVSPRSIRLHPGPLLSVQLRRHLPPPVLPLSPTCRLFPPDSLLLSLPKGPRNLKILFSLHLPLHVPVGAPPAPLQPVLFSRAGDTHTNHSVSTLLQQRPVSP